MRVLFLHGLESSPHGSKVLMLRAQGFEVTAPDLHMGLTQLSRKNSALRMLLRLTELRLLVLLGVTSVIMACALRVWPLGLVGTLVAALWLSLRRKALVAAALARSFASSVQIASEALGSNASSIDVLIGSSWGGAVAAELVALGRWRGPTVLLAPAVAAVARRTGRADLEAMLTRLRESCAAAPVVAYHDPNDETVPYADSVALAEASGLELRTVDAGGHRLMPLLERGELAEALRRLPGASA